jgi:hypothetical protein
MEIVFQSYRNEKQNIPLYASLTHGASVDPEAAGVADAANGAAATQSSRKHAHSCMLAMDRAKKC